MARVATILLSKCSCQTLEWCYLYIIKGLGLISLPTSQHLLAILRQGIDFYRAGKLPDAENCYLKVLAESPDEVDALNLLGVLRRAEGRGVEALALFDQALETDWCRPTVHYDRAGQLEELGRKDEAIAAYRLAIQFKSDFVEAYLNLGVLEYSAGKLDGATEIFQKVISLASGYAPGHFNLGRCYFDHKNFAAAELAFKTALQLVPDYFDALIMLAKCHADCDRYSQAIAYLDRALTIKPGSPLVLTNLGTYLTYQDRHDEALSLYEKALAQNPEYHSARVNCGLTHLVKCQLSRGWDGIWLRAETTGSFAFRKLDLPWPRWQGERLDGKRLFLWGEQGLGDEILFSSIVAEVASMADSCVFGCSPRLVGLFRRSFPGIDVEPLNDVLKDVKKRQFDYHSSIIDLGRWRRRHLESFPHQASFLIGDPSHIAHNRAHYRALYGTTKKLIGFSWRSFAPHIGHLKTPSLDVWQALLSDPTVHLINFQHGTPELVAPDLQHLSSLFGARLSEPASPELSDDIDALAAHLAAMDGIVTVSNTLAHLAGSLGIPGLVLVPEGKARLWYWFKEGSDSPWYPSLCIARSPAELKRGLLHLSGQPNAKS